MSDRLKSRKFWLVIGMTLLNAGLLISGHIEAGHFVTLQSATIAPYLVGQSAVDTWGKK